MKNFKKLFLVPVLALGTVTSCYGGNNDTNCPEEKKCETCPTPSESQGGTISKDGHSLTVEQSEIKVLVDENIGKTKQIYASVTPSSDTITYTSSDSSVATVSNKGVITGVTPNKECTITVKSSGNLLSAIKVKTYSVGTYFQCVSSGIRSVIDPEVEELEFPATNPITGEAMTSIWTTFSFSNYTNNGTFSFPRLKKIIIPSGYTKVENFAFGGLCASCEYLELPATLTTIYSGSISGLNNLKEIVVEEGNTTFAVSTYEENGSKIFYQIAQKNIYKVFNHTTGLVCDPALGITQMEYYSIYNDSRVTNITIPDGVTTLRPRSVFYNKNLKSISLPNTLTTISASGHSFCSANPNLETLTIRDTGFFGKFTSIDENGDAMNAIAWVNNGAASLVTATKNVDMSKKVKDPANTENSVTITSIDKNVFLGLDLEGIYKIPSNINAISEYAFAFNPRLKGIYIPNSVGSITTAATNNSNAFTVSPSYEGYVYNDGEFLLIPSIYFCHGLASSFIFGADDNCVVYYQTRTDNTSFYNKFTYSALLHNKGLYSTKEVVDSTLAEPVQEESQEG